jgi:hypothetical protein
MIRLVGHGQVRCSWNCFDGANMDRILVHIHATLTMTVDILKRTRCIECEFTYALLAFLQMAKRE